MRIYYVRIGTRVMTDLFSTYTMDNTVEHEKIHLFQYRDIRDNPSSFWEKIADYYYISTTTPPIAHCKKTATFALTISTTIW